MYSHMGGPVDLVHKAAVLKPRILRLPEEKKNILNNTVFIL